VVAGAGGGGGWAFSQDRSTAAEQTAARETSDAVRMEAVWVMAFPS
jgi:hypothetical protein